MQFQNELHEFDKTTHSCLSWNSLPILCNQIDFNCCYRLYTFVKSSPVWEFSCEGRGETNGKLLHIYPLFFVFIFSFKPQTIKDSWWRRRKRILKRTNRLLILTSDSLGLVSLIDIRLLANKTCATSRINSTKSNQSFGVLDMLLRRFYLTHVPNVYRQKSKGHNLRKYGITNHCRSKNYKQLIRDKLSLNLIPPA